MEIKEWFRYFFAKTYPTQMEGADARMFAMIDKLGEDFDEYLKGKFHEETIKKWYPKTMLEVFLGEGDPFKHHGFSLPLSYHFFDYLEIKAKELSNG